MTFMINMNSLRRVNPMVRKAITFGDVDLIKVLQIHVQDIISFEQVKVREKLVRGLVGGEHS